MKNLKKLDPDLLYFSGDQIYEPNGGYRIIRQPADLSILNYLGKYYMFGWAFGDLMRTGRPFVHPMIMRYTRATFGVKGEATD